MQSPLHGPESLLEHRMQEILELGRAQHAETLEEPGMAGRRMFQCSN